MSTPRPAVNDCWRLMAVAAKMTAITKVTQAYRQVSDFLETTCH